MSGNGRLIDYLELAAYGRRKDIPAVCVKWMLRGFAVLYSASIELYRLPFLIGLRRQNRLGCPVVSVGNITVGGTGKTPMVQHLCRELLIRGLRPAVLSYGYGGSLAGRVGVVSDGKTLMLTAAECGDEPFMLAQSLPDVPVLVGKHRHVSGEKAISEFGVNVLVLDDGFQVWKLHRDVDIVLLSNAEPFDNGWTLPAGRLREPASSVRRADCVVLTGVEEGDDADQQVQRIAEGLEVFRVRTVALGVHMLSHSGIDSPDAVRGRRVLALSSIGNPRGFGATLKELGADIVGVEEYRDHHAYSSEDIGRISGKALESGAEWIATTAKDAVKLIGSNFSMPVAVVEIEVCLDGSDRFWELVENEMKGASL